MGNENNESAASASEEEEEEVTIDVDRFLRIGNRTKGGPDRAARIVCRKEEEEEEEEEDTQRAAPDLGSPSQNEESLINLLRVYYKGTSGCEAIMATW